MTPWLSPLCLVLEKNIQFGILFFQKSKKYVCEAICEAVNVMNTVYFYENFFGFTKKILPLFIMQLFFSKYFLPQPPVMFSTDFNQSVICSFTKRVQKIAIKRGSSPKHFLEATKGIERLQQNASDKLRFSDPDSEQAQ